MAVDIRQIHPVFVGEVSGVDLRQPLLRDEVAAIEVGMDRYAVLVFHDQNITDEQQIAFSRNSARSKTRPAATSPRRIRSGSAI
jgi:alpha-ketoglutarate-dependent 2,4-dichlorophenoxyacetate dioxygenase